MLKFVLDQYAITYLSSYRPPAEYPTDNLKILPGGALGIGGIKKFKILSKSHCHISQGIMNPAPEVIQTLRLCDQILSEMFAIF